MTSQQSDRLEAYEYDEREWQESAGHAPLAGRLQEDFLLLHRHWMWANQCREAFEAAIAAQPLDQATMLASKSWGFMLVWYGMLWAVIEAAVAPAEGRSIEIRGAFRRDIDGMSDLLRRCRNAVLHVPKSGSYFDDRIEALVREPSAVFAIRRMHNGFGRMFLEEGARRKAG